MNQNRLDAHRVNHLNIYKIIKSTKKHLENYGVDEYFYDMCDAVIASCKPSYIFYFALEIKEADRDFFSIAMAKTLNPLYIVWFAEYVDGANIPVLQDAILRIGDLKEIINFARDIPGADVELLCQNVIHSRDPLAIFRFAIEVQGADIWLLSREMAKTQDPYYMHIFAKEFEQEADLDALREGVIKYGSDEQIYLFAKEFGDDQEKNMQKAMLMGKDYRLLVKFARFVNGSDRHELLQRARELKMSRKIKKVEEIILNLYEEN